MGVRRAGRAAAGPAQGPAVNAADGLPHATLKDLRKSTRQTQEDLAAALGVGQDTISRLEHRSDMLLSTLRHYIESVGGQLELVATFPGQAPVIIDQIGERKRKAAKRRRRAARAGGGAGLPRGTE